MFVNTYRCQVSAMVGVMFLLLPTAMAINASLNLDLSLNVEFNGFQTTCNCKMRTTVCTTRTETCERCQKPAPNITLIFDELTSAMKPESSKTLTTAPDKLKTKNYRIPTDLKPERYVVDITPNISDPDPAKFYFKGSVSITMRYSKATDRLYLHTKGLTINRVAFYGRPKMLSYTEDKERELLIVQLDSNTTKGYRYFIDVNFTAPLTKEPKGLFYSQYMRDEKPVYLILTNLKPNYARRVFPCFDEPNIRAQFDLHLRTPANYTVLSNVAPKYIEPVGADGTYVHHFFHLHKPTPPYLLAFVMCDFIYNETILENGVTFRVWSRPELITNTTYAFEHGSEAISFYENFFHNRLQLSKLDMVAVPEFETDGSENFGLIIIREDRMLTKSNKPCGNVSPVVNRLIAQQWFSRWNAHKWWDEQWLIDGIIDLVSKLGVNHFYPEWLEFERFIAELYQVMSSDSSVSSHPIYRPVNDPSELNHVLDTITTKKTTAVLRMLRQFIGFRYNNFQNGLSYYVMSVGDVANNTLWSSLRQSAEYEHRYIDVKEVMDTWTLQMNYPLVTVTRHNSYSGYLRVRQERFLENPNEKDLGTYVSPFNYTWDIPLTFAINKTRDFDDSKAQIFWLWRNETSKLLLVGPNQRFPSKDTWFICNINMNGYYRVNYDIYNWMALAKQLKEDHEVIPLTNRMQIINDAMTLAESNLLTYDVVFSILGYLENEREFLVFREVLLKLEYVTRMLFVSPAYGSFQNFMQNITKDFYLYAMNNTRNESKWIVDYSQYYIAYLACHSQLPECVQDATESFKKWMDDPSNPINLTHPFPFYCSAISKGGEEEWNFLFEMNKANRLHTSYLIGSSACTTATWLFNKLLHMAIDADSPIPKESRTLIFQYSTGPLGRSLKWNFFRNNFDKLKELYEDSTVWSSIIDHVTLPFNTEWDLKELKTFKLQHEGNFGSGEAAMSKAIKTVETNVQWMNKHYNTIETWLKANVD